MKMRAALSLPVGLLVFLVVATPQGITAAGAQSSKSQTTPASAAQTAAAAQKQAEPTDIETPVRQVPDPGAITTNQAISPAGVQSVFESRVYGIAFGASSNEVYAATTSQKGALVYRMDWRSNRVLDKLIHSNSSPGMQGLTYDPVANSILLTTIGKTGVELVKTWNNDTKQPANILGRSEVAGVALSPKGAPGTRYAVVALTFNNQAAILDLTTGALLSKVMTGIAPFGVVIDDANTSAYVTNWGGRFPRTDDQTATTGSNAQADRIVIDDRGVAASGTLSRIDLKTGTVTAEMEVGLHPTALALDSSRNRLYVANSNSDTISVVDTLRNAVVETISVEPFAKNVAGVAPEALVLSKDGRRLYVVCAGINAVAVLALDRGKMKIDGLIPTGWYPDAIALSPDGKYLGVSTLLGVGSGWKNAPIDPTAKAIGLENILQPTAMYTRTAGPSTSSLFQTSCS